MSVCANASIITQNLPCEARRSPQNESGIDLASGVGRVSDKKVNGRRSREHKHDPGPNASICSTSTSKAPNSLHSAAARHCYGHIEGINVEVNFEELYRGCCQIEELDRFLGERGFRRVATASPFHPC
jgi:hypothetical protein